MKATILDGSHENDRTGECALAALMAELQVQGWNVEHIVLRDKEIGPCAGDFFCWIRTPGTCMLDDDNRAIAAAVVASDLMVYLTPVTFGGYSSALKRMVDHQIQNISPYFAKVEGETHHQKRYERNPDFLAVGWMDAPDAETEGVFRHLVQRNAINFFAQKSASGVVLDGQSVEVMRASMRAWLGELDNGLASGPANLPARNDASAVLGAGSGKAAFEIRRALLLVGSPKTRKSTSYLLGEYLLDKLGARSIETETIYLHTSVRSPEKMQALLEAVDAADLVAAGLSAVRGLAARPGDRVPRGNRRTP